jgi:ATP-dependent DNA helicase RecG
MTKFQSGFEASIYDKLHAMNSIGTAVKTIDIQQLTGVGPSMASKLNKLGIYTVQDLLFHLPLRYQDRTRIVALHDVRPGGEYAIEGEIQSTQIKFGRTRSLLCLISDGSSAAWLRFFHFSKAQQQGFQVGRRLRCYGSARLTKLGIEIAHPEYHFVQANEPAPLEKSLTPVYPTTEGLHQLSWRKLTDQALRLLQHEMSVQELLPQNLLEAYQLADLKSALCYVHRPPPDADVKQLMLGTHPFQQRLACEELLAHHLSLQKLRQKVQKHPAKTMENPGKLKAKFTQQLPFELTGAQTRVLQDMQVDLIRPHPMLRLVQGDVGSGKTVVSALAALQVIESGYQVALMAPTELLAEQHYQNFQQWFEPLGLEVAWLSGQVKVKARRETLEKIADGRANMVVGTHALFQEAVQFHQLALVIIDEQHRFGVHQRLALRNKGVQQGFHPHQLVMTATPIPRTLAMTAYADLDYSVIDELPPGRTPVKTVAVINSKRDEVVSRIAAACEAKKQAYWVCTLIEESEMLQAQAAESVAESLRQSLPQLNIALVHGRMKAAEKNGIMQAFKSRQYDLLVATTVIEVGVDVPNASLMVIENAERLGLSQLHQLRGRVGRGSVASHCVLLYQPPLSQTAKMRVDVMRQTTDGFKIAEKDLEIRGPGEVLGTKQTGLVQLRVADLIRDRDLLPTVRKISADILKAYPDVPAKLVKRWLPEKAEQYAKV